jgi:hypothetical protein
MARRTPVSEPVDDLFYCTGSETAKKDIYE